MKLDSSVGCFIILVSILGGFLVGEPLLNASGLLQMLDPRFVSQFKAGVWIACVGFGSLLILYGFRTLLYFAMIVVEKLERVPLKPKMPFAIAFILFGTICIVGVIGLEIVTMLNSMQHPALMTRIQNVVGQGDGSIHAYFANQAGVFLIAQVFALLIFVTGCSLIALGVWSSIPGQATRTP